MASSLPKPKHRRATNDRAHGDDSWVDPIADDVSALLRESGLQMELVVFYDPITETLHAVGYDGSAQRYFTALGTEGASVPQPRAAPNSASSVDAPRSTQTETSAP
jgi:hypothetical protein